MKEKLKKITEYEWELPKEARPGMNVNARIIANEKIMGDIEDSAVEQLTNVACLPGVAEPVVGLPDMHFGYGLPMGAVSAFDPENGIISAGLCGFDINCGINSIRTSLTFDEIKPKLKQLITELFSAIPCGVGSKGKLRIKENELEEVMRLGSKWAVEKGYGIQKDIENTEEKGCMQGADPSKVSAMARKRGLPQLGTLGAGNHFLEIQKVTGIFDPDYAKSIGIADKGQAMVMLHCGSRGLGHQVASDYLKIQEKAVRKYNLKIPDRQLACAPVNSPEGQDYYSAMKCAVNYAFANRQVMAHWIRETFEKVFRRQWEDMGMHTVYAVCHNVVKLENINGKNYYVHRKGATRSYPEKPVLIAGTMGTASYICKGTQEALNKTFGSSCHGSGRAMSRNEALRRFKGQSISSELTKMGIENKAGAWGSFAEEAPKSYKDVEDVVDSVHNAGISTKVTRIEPIGVIKG